MSRPSTEENNPPPGEVSRVVEHLFRHEAGKMVATLTRIFGLEHLTLAEDVVQEALSRALQTWPFYGVPTNPAAWIMRASRNLALDVVRRQKVFREKEREIVALMEETGAGEAAAGFDEHEILDDRLRMMFVCCHPLVPGEAQAALALKTLCGFSVTEISRAFLTSEAAMAKRLTRARQRIREEGIRFEIPRGEELVRRLDGVLQTLYLLFNEGYKASTGEKLIREELCQEAIRLAGLLAKHPSGDWPKTHALLAVMLLNCARLPARVDGDGNLLRLNEQDRTRWDPRMIALGMYHFGRSAAGDSISEYHLQAGIAACHCAAPDDASTDWGQILKFYNQLLELDDSPVIELNRAIVIGKIQGPAAGREAVAGIRHRAMLDQYYLLYAALGEFEAQLNDPMQAAGYFQKAMDLAEIKSERIFLQKRCQDQREKASVELRTIEN